MHNHKIQLKRRMVAGACVSLAMVASFAVVGNAASSASQVPKTPKLIIGVIHPGSTSDAGYNQAQQAGITYLKAHMKGVEVLEATNVPETSQVTTDMQTMINHGAKLIFPMDFGYQSFAYTLAQSNPKVDFEQPGGYLVAKNFGDYWANSDDINYALGAAAAKMAKNGKIGFIGAVAIPTVLCSAIAFHLGAQSVNPHIKTYVLWSDAWSDPTEEKALVGELHADGVGVLGTLVDSPVTILKTAASDHMLVVAYHSAAGEKIAPKAWLSSVAFNWGPMFVKMATAVENHTWAKSGYDSNYVAPLKSNTAYMAPWGSMVTTAAKTAAESALAPLWNATMRNPYKGPIYNQAGQLVVKAGSYLSQSQQQNVNWLAKGMIGSPE